MRHKYDTQGIVLARTPLGEANTLITVLTPGLGIVRARAQGLRKSGAKLAAALATLAHSDLALVQGKEGWRITGAVLRESWAPTQSHEVRLRAARVLGLLVRLVVDERRDDALFVVVASFLEALAREDEGAHEAVELLAVLRLLAILGLDAGEIPGALDAFTPEVLALVREMRSEYIARINHGLEASGL